MAQRANIVLTDAASTPVAHTFYPTGQTKDGIISWVDRTQAIATGQARLTLSQRVGGTKSSKAYKMSWKLETPVLEATSPSTSTGIQPAPTVAYTPLGVIEVVLPDRSTLQERKDLLAQLRDLIDEAINTNLVENYDLIW